jgi:hypothetical protein
VLRKTHLPNNLVILAACVLLTGMAGAEPAPPPPDVVFIAKSPGGCAIGASGNAVKNAPYSGVGTTEVVRMLPDGNRIVRTNTMRYFRDSQGRTRTEHELSAVGPFTLEQMRSIIMIDDPVAARHYVLHPELKRADELVLPASFASATGPTRDPARAGSASGSADRRASTTAAGSPGGPALSVDVPTLSSGGPEYSVSVPGPAVDEHIVATSDAAGSDDGSAKQTNVAGARVLTTRVGAIMALGPGCGPGGIDAKALPPAISLGERTIEGVKVIGSRHEFVIATGEIGNDQPITVRNEQWFSPELGVVVESKLRDPLVGDTTYRLSQIRRTPPDASLFAVPADYTIESMPPPGAGVAKFKAVAPESR